MKQSKEMNDFADRFGGLVKNSAFKDVEDSKFFSAGLKVGNHWIDSIVGRTNTTKMAFQYELNGLLNPSSNAVCGLVGNVFCIGISFGLYLKVAEISALAVAYLSSDQPAIETAIETGFGFRYHEIVTNTGTDEAVDHFSIGFAAALSQVPRRDWFLYATNILILFVCFHESRHAIDGHVLLLADENRDFYLGESQSSPIENFNSMVCHYIEFEADTIAFSSLLTNILNDHLFFSTAITSIEAAKICLATVLLLANSWHFERPEGSESHPTGSERLFNIFCVLHELEEAHPVHKGDVARLRSFAIEFGAKLADANPNFRSLGPEVTTQGTRRYWIALNEFFATREFQMTRARLDQVKFSRPEDFGR